jgi:hypothetical protein
MAGTHSYNTLVEYADDSGFSTNKTAVSYIMSLEGPDRQVTRVNTTHLKSTGAVKTSIPGFIDDGTITFTCDYDETIYNNLETIFLARSASAAKYWRVTLPDESTLIGQGFIQGLNGPSVPEDDRLTYTLTICPLAGWSFTEVDS